MSENKTISDADAAQMKLDQAVIGSVKKWKFFERSTPEAACDFINSPPAQGAGEAMLINMPNGNIGIFYFISQP